MHEPVLWLDKVEVPLLTWENSDVLSPTNPRGRGTSQVRSDHTPTGLSRAEVRELASGIFSEPTKP